MGTPRRGEERLSSQLGDIGNRRREIRRKRRLPWSSDSCGGREREGGGEARVCLYYPQVLAKGLLISIVAWDLLVT